MRELVIDNFDFSNEDHRAVLTEHKDFTFGHYKVDGGDATVAGARIGNYLFYGVSLCSPQDNFSKEVGRVYAADHLVAPEFSHKRGRMRISDSIINEPPAFILKLALERHVDKMRQRPHWMRERVVTFRSNRR